MEERLQKIIARVGIASRRQAETLILDGLVKVNGKVATLGQKADPENDHIKVKGKLISTAAEEKAYYLMYKPRGVITTAHDAEGRPTATELMAHLPMRLFPVGRLDLDSEGLLLMTNDGDLANALMHPKSEVGKRYRVKTKGIPGERILHLLRAGIRLDDGRTRPAEVEMVETTKTNAWLDVIIHEGRNRQIRRMFDKVGHSVVKLRRTGYAFLGVGKLKPGTYRELTPAEIERLKRVADGQDQAGKGTLKPARKNAPASAPAQKAKPARVTRPKVKDAGKPARRPRSTSSGKTVSSGRPTRKRS